MKQTTCRHCGKKIYLVERALEHRTRWGSNSWWSHHTSIGPIVTSRGDDMHAKCADGSWADPREICGFWKESDGSECTNPVKHEDIESENYACGVHMRQYLREKRQKADRERYERKRKEEEEVARWELGIYQEAYDRLTVIDPELFPPEERPELKRYYRNFEREAKIDIVRLERWMRNHAKDPTVAEG